MNRLLTFFASTLGATIWSNAELIAHYPFDTNSNDASQNGNHLVISSGSPAITTAEGTFRVGSGALNLDQSGTEQHLAFTTPINLVAAQPWSIAWWGKRGASTPGTHGGIVGTNANSNNFVWTPDNPNVVRGLRVRDNTGAQADYSDIPDDNAWHHWVVVYDGDGEVEVWRDNTSLGSQTFSGNLTLTHVGAITANKSNSFWGQLDDLRIYSQALDAAAIAALFNVDSEPPPTPEPVERVRVFLIGGQSNADGRAEPDDLPVEPVNLQQPQDDVDYYETSLTTLRPLGQFGPEITMGRRLADSIGDGVSERIAIIKYGVGGTSLSSDWKAGGDATTVGDGPRYVTFQQTVTNGMTALAAAHPDATIAIEGMLWVQGERDVVIGTHAEYEANLTAFIADVRATYGEGLPFVISRLSTGQTALDAGRLSVVRAAQDAVAAADPLSALLDTDTFGIKTDNLHFDAAGQQHLGDDGAKHLLQFRPIHPQPAFLLTPEDLVEMSLDGAFPDFIYTLQHNPTLAPDEWEEVETVIPTGRQVDFAPFAGAPDRDFFRVIRTSGL